MAVPNRRLFLKQASMATLSSVVAAVPIKAETLISGISGNIQAAGKALLPIAYSDIYIQGELLSRAMRNYDRLESDLYWPENDFAPKGRNPNAASPGDKEGRIILGLTLQAQATHRRPVYLSQIVELMPKYVNPKGYLGPILKGKIDEQQLSGHGFLLRGLCEYYIWKKDPEVKRHILNITNHLALPVKDAFLYYPVDPKSRIQNVGEVAGTIQNTVGEWMLSSDIGCYLLLLDGVTQVYDLFPSTELKSLIEEMIACFQRMDIVSIKAQTHSTLTGLRGILRYYHTTGNRELLKLVEDSYAIYRNKGMTANFENLNWFDRPKWTEPCAIIDSFMVAVQLWQITDKSHYLEDAHLIYYNAIGHTQRENGGFGLDNCTSPAEPSLYVKDDEAWWCCTMRGGEGMAAAIQYNYFLKDNEVVIPFFNSSEAVLRLKGGNIALKQISEYPFNGFITWEVQDSKNNRPVTLKWLAPFWSKNHQLKINGNSVSFEKINGFLMVNMIMKNGTTIELSFEQNPEIGEQTGKQNSNNRYHSIAYGPLLLGYEGDKEVNIPANAEMIRESTTEWRVKGTDIKLTPIHHFMNAEVREHSGYRKQILFPSQNPNL